MENQSRILIVQGNDTTRSLLETFISNNSQYELVGSVNNFISARVILSRIPVDLVVIDMSIEDEEGGQFRTTKMKENHPDLKVIWTMDTFDSELISKAHELKVESVFANDNQLLSLDEVVERTLKGESIYPVREEIFELGIISSREITAREKQIIEHLANEESDKEIATKLGISVEIVRKRITDLLNKTNIASRSQLVETLRKRGF